MTRSRSVRGWSPVATLAAFSLALLLIVSGASCGATSEKEAATTVLVFGASSLTDAFADIEAAFEQANPDLDVKLNLAGSSALREQVLEGAPADVFASADWRHVEALIEAGEVAEDAATAFARNRLQVAVPEGNPAGVGSLSDLADEDLLVGLCATGVPCGDLARQALATVGIEAAVDTNEPDVRSLLTKIGAGELDAGIVYATDVASAAESVDGIPIDPQVQPDIVYPAAVTSRAPNPTGAAAFVRFLVTEPAQTIMAGHGFEAP